MSATPSVAPQPLGGISWARTIHNTVRGQIECKWAIVKNRFTLHLKVPSGTRARVALPSRDGPQCQDCGPGRYALKSELSKGQFTRQRQ